MKISEILFMLGDLQGVIGDVEVGILGTESGLDKRVHGFVHVEVIGPDGVPMDMLELRTEARADEGVTEWRNLDEKE